MEHHAFLVTMFEHHGDRNAPCLGYSQLQLPNAVCTVSVQFAHRLDA